MVNINQIKNLPRATPSLRGVEFFPRGERGERRRSAWDISSLVFVYIFLKHILSVFFQIDL